MPQTPSHSTRKRSKRSRKSRSSSSSSADENVNNQSKRYKGRIPPIEEQASTMAEQAATGVSLQSLNDKLDLIHATLLTTDRSVGDLKESVVQISKTLEYALDEFEDIKSDNRQLRKEIGTCTSKINILEAKCDEQKENILDLQCRQMRDNLLFFNLPEIDEESTNRQGTESVLRGFLNAQLKIPDDLQTKEIHFDRVHRIGKKQINKTRPIVAKFNPYKGKLIVLDHSKNLRGTKFGIGEQYPPEIQARRKTLVPIMKQYRDAGARVKLSVDKLYVNGQLYTESSHRSIPAVTAQKGIHVSTDDPPGEHSSIAINVDTFIHSDLVSVKNTTFQAHAVRITSKEQVKAALSVLKIDEQIQKATHLMSAYRLYEQGNWGDGYNDDRESTAGKRLLEIMTEENLFGILVVVSQWSREPKLGLERFKTITTMGRAIMKRLTAT